jgi:GNAT superfamily N-acetyltransferase
MTLRPATPADAPAMARILRGWADQTGWMPGLHRPDEDVGFCAHLVATHAVSVLDLSGPRGFLARDRAEIVALFLAPQVRGLGHGTALLDRAKAASDHLSLWTFSANPGAIAFYRRNGFAELAQSDGRGNEERMPDVRMAWQRGK